MTRRISKRTGKSYAVGSSHGWQNWTGPRTCCVCGARVTLDQGSQQHEEAGVKTLRHLECKVLGGA